MRYQLFTNNIQDNYDIAILIKPTSFNKDALEKYYIDLFEDHGITRDRIIAYTLQYNGGKVRAKPAKEYLKNLLPVLKDLGVKYIYCADAAYFKLLSKQRKAEANLGYKFPVENTNMEVTLGINYSSIKHNPDNLNKLKLSIQTVKDILNDNFEELGTNIINNAYYPTKLVDIENALNSLLSTDSLSCDIECYSLDAEKAGLSTIAFATDKNNGIAFPIDYITKHKPNKPVRDLLKKFFESYKGNLKFHNASYDVKVLVYQLFMKDFTDTQGMRRGIKILTKNIDDTKIIAYLATNSVAKPSLSLKSLAHEFAGNYAQDNIKDVRKIPLDELLKYNLVDCLATWFVYEKHYPTLIKDNQQDLYNGLMLDSLRMLIQTELSGMPIDLTKVAKAKKELNQIVQNCFDTFKQFGEIKETELIIRHQAVENANKKIKTVSRKHNIDMPRYKELTFNPNSGVHLQTLLYDVMNLPVLGLTDTKQPATGGKILEKLLNHCTENQKPLIQALIDYKGVDKILSSFIPAFEDAVLHEDGYHYLHGSFHIGGTVSGRLSSSDPNLQNLPSGSLYGKLIKDCFIAPSGWIFCGADFNALEDRINTLLTKDPNKLKVFLDGYDGHCLRAYYYFKDQMPDINPDSVESINSIKHKYPKLRNLSKAPSFALQYAGTYITLMKNCGFSEEEARFIEANYHELYRESDEWIKRKLAKACNTGYVDLAFGLKLRTPLLKQSILGTSSTLYEAEAEARTAGNALSGQSYGLLNNRAAVAFMKKVHQSKWKDSIKPVALIHDAIYLLIKDDIECLEWVNNNLIEEMNWQELPEIQHPKVHLEAELDVFYPSWSNPITLPNKASQEELLNVINQSIGE